MSLLSIITFLYMWFGEVIWDDMINLLLFFLTFIFERKGRQIVNGGKAGKEGNRT